MQYPVTGLEFAGITHSNGRQFRRCMSVSSSNKNRTPKRKKEVFRSGLLDLFKAEGQSMKLPDVSWTFRRERRAEVQSPFSDECVYCAGWAWEEDFYKFLGARNSNIVQRFTLDLNPDNAYLSKSSYLFFPSFVDQKAALRLPFLSGLSM
ncbi:hypothetical protein L218DRAFT_948108 [Marasmius fiardii PR-910]|nr:hypothetical protein L218DRAFT_948108 [Marasmius fiardii PR-910]